MSSQCDTSTTWFVTRHAGAKQWAVEEGIEIDRLVEHLEVDWAKPGDIVIGSLPIDLVALLNSKNVRYFHLVLPLSHQWRGKHLSVEMMRSLGARLDEYIARKV